MQTGAGGAYGCFTVLEWARAERSVLRGFLSEPRTHTVVEERQANARLISAAPDLLLALTWLLSIEGQNDRETLDEQRPLALAAARAAIAAATGEG